MGPESSTLHRVGTLSSNMSRQFAPALDRLSCLGSSRHVWSPATFYSAKQSANSGARTRQAFDGVRSPQGRIVTLISERVTERGLWSSRGASSSAAILGCKKHDRNRLEVFRHMNGLDRTVWPASGPWGRSVPETPLPTDGAAKRLALDLPWMLADKARIPKRVSGYFHRPDLVEKVAPMRRRATVLKAPGGFGKTTLLAEICRNLRDEGVLAAWVTLDLPDTISVLTSHLAVAFQVTGLNVPNLAKDTGGGEQLSEWPADAVAHAITVHDAPCVLAVDELERITDPVSVETLNFLLHWGPPNLHLALACREIPVGLDVGSLVLDGRGLIVTAGDLRFTKPEIKAFLGTRSSRQDIAAVAHRSKGWPIALSILRDDRSRATIGDTPRRWDVADNWVESRLWRDLTKKDRDLLLDIGLFEWIESSLLDDVLERKDLKRLIDEHPGLDGLLETVRIRGADRCQLHPMIKEHCARRRQRETPDRFRLIHRRIALALAARNEALAAMRHAAAAGDAELVAKILEDAGGLRLWLRDGFVALQTAESFLAAEYSKKNARLVLARCVVLIFTGRLEEAKQAYVALADGLCTAAGDGAEDVLDLQLDDCVVRGLMCVHGCQPLDSKAVIQTLNDITRYCELPGLDSAIRSFFELGLCVAHHLRAEFGAALGRAHLARRHAVGNPYVEMCVELHCGQVAMAQGQTTEAAACYAKAHKIAQANDQINPGPSLYATILIRELNLERLGTAEVDDALSVPYRFIESGASFAPFAAAVDCAVDCTLQRQGVDAAIDAVQGLQNSLRDLALPEVDKHLAAWHVSLLTIAGRAADAEAMWVREGLPDGRSQCLDLSHQSWRVMEAVSCARLRLHFASGAYDSGRRFAQALLLLTTERNMRRTSMRALAILIALEGDAGHVTEAKTYFAQFLELYEDTDYARPLVRVADSCTLIIDTFVEDNPDQSKLPLIEHLKVRFASAKRPPETGRNLTFRELDILELLESLPDREIARKTNLSEAGVRYHIGNIFTKLGARSRRDAVHTARRHGLIP